MNDNKLYLFKLGNGKDDYSEHLLSIFEEMPDQAKCLLLHNLSSIQGDAGNLLYQVLFRGCKSPIEYTFIIAFCILFGVRNDELWEFYNDSDEYDVAKSVCIERLDPQYQIDANGKTYFADFYLYVEYYGGEIEGIDQFQKIIIECDGFEYHHATKEQVNHDNERELAIKKAGYDVLRFSGSQIYNDPFKCADDTIDYIIAEMNRRCIAEGTDG